MVTSHALTDHQLQTFEQFQNEGLVALSGDRYRLTILGEVFMGAIGFVT